MILLLIFFFAPVFASEENLFLERQSLRNGASNGIKESLFMQSSFLNEEQKRDYFTLFSAAQTSFTSQNELFTAPKNIYNEAVRAFKKNDIKKSEELFALSLTYLDRIPVTPLEAIQKAIEIQKNRESQDKVIFAGREFLNTIVQDIDGCQTPLEQALKPFHQGFQFAKKAKDLIAKGEDPTLYQELVVKLWQETETLFLHPQPPPQELDNRTIEELREMALLDVTQKPPTEKESRGLKPW